MTDFFHGTRPGQPVEMGGQTFEMPILYFRDDAFVLFFTADYERVKAQMPSDNLHPVTLPRQKAMIGLAAFNYMDTSIGSYGEVGVVVPAVYASKPPPSTIPTLLESRYSGFGLVVSHLPATNTIARDGGRLGWGYTKFVADMNFGMTPEYMECRVSEEDQHILTTRVTRGGIFKRDKKPLITYSVKDGNLIKTTIPQKGSFRMSLNPTGSFLLLGHHPVSESIRDMGISTRPILSRYYVERSAILPHGQVIEQGVRPMEGYFGRDRDGEHTVVYL